MTASAGRARSVARIDRRTADVDGAGVRRAAGTAFAAAGFGAGAGFAAAFCLSFFRTS
jgi:hypothetical protein